MYSQLLAAQIKLNSSKTILDIWKNGGNANLEQEVETINSWDVYIEFNNLLAESPYLSDEVLIACVENPAFTSLMIKLIMIANPQSASSALVMESIYSRIPSLPESYIEEILDESEETSPLDELIGHVSTDYHLLCTIGEDIKRVYKTDTINISAKDSLIAFVSRQPDLMHRYELASIYLGYNMFDEMNICLYNITSDFELIEMEQEDHNNILTVYEIAEQMYSEQMYINSLSEEQISTLETIISLNRPVLSPAAVGLIIRNNPEYEYFATRESLPSPSENGKSNSKDIKQISIISAFEFYPNPARDFITLNIIHKVDESNPLLLEIHNVQGKKMLWKQMDKEGEQLIDLNRLTSGLYTISIYRSGILLESKKLNLIN